MVSSSRASCNTLLHIRGRLFGILCLYITLLSLSERILFALFLSCELKHIVGNRLRKNTIKYSEKHRKCNHLLNGVYKNTFQMRIERQFIHLSPIKDDFHTPVSLAGRDLKSGMRRVIHEFNKFLPHIYHVTKEPMVWSIVLGRPGCIGMYWWIKWWTKHSLQHDGDVRVRGHFRQMSDLPSMTDTKLNVVRWLWLWIWDGGKAHVCLCKHVLSRVPRWANER